MVTVLKFLRWLFQKLGAAVLMVGLALAAWALLIFLKDNVDFDLRHNEIVRALTGQRAEIRDALADVHHRQEKLLQEITAEKKRAEQAAGVIRKLRELESAWDKFVGNPEQQKANAEQMARMETLRLDAETKVAELEAAYTRGTWERDGLELALGKLETQITKAQAQRSKIMHYLEQAWERSKWWIAGVLALYFFGPSVAKLFLYYAMAPIIMRGRPVRLNPAAGALPEVGASRVSLDVPLREGNRLWIRERFLQSSDEGVVKKTRFLLDWKIPFTCLASGLTEMIELKPAKAAGEQHVTLSNQANPHIELALITLGEGSTLVLRPSFLAGLATEQGRKVRIRRRWQIFRWQAWVTMQFRYFEFVGPARLIVAGSRGVRVERLAATARRTNQDATIGFTPALDYKPVRAETFWGYYRDMNPLFDDLFAGEGFFLCQEISTEGAAGNVRKFWAGLWSSALKVFGL